MAHAVLAKKNHTIALETKTEHAFRTIDKKPNELFSDASVAGVSSDGWVVGLRGYVVVAGGGVR